MKLTNRTAWL